MNNDWNTMFPGDEEDKTWDPLLSDMQQEHLTEMQQEVVLEMPQEEALISEEVTQQRKESEVSVTKPPKGGGWRLESIILADGVDKNEILAWVKDGKFDEFLKENKDCEFLKNTFFVPNQEYLGKAGISYVDSPEDGQYALRPCDITLDLPADMQYDEFGFRKSVENNVDQFKKPFEKNLAGIRMNPSHQQDYRLYLCEVKGCAEVFKTREALQKHTAAHWEKQHVCRICEKGFVNNQQLQQHFAVHSQPNAFKCKYPHCGRSFSMKTALVTHYRMHTQKTKSNCEFCGRNFANAVTLKSHMRKIHPETDWLYPDSEVHQLYNRFNGIRMPVKRLQPLPRHD